ncbi:hypothetical protein [Henriciella aquimarina]|nr:hypothetical protein [Henriciella aquimarina]
MKYAVAPAMDVVDSRYENFEFALPEVVAKRTTERDRFGCVSINVEA